MKLHSRPQTTRSDHRKRSHLIYSETLSIPHSKNTWVSPISNQALSKNSPCKTTKIKMLNPQLNPNKEFHFQKQQKLPLSFYFDTKLRQKIIHNVIDQYLEPHTILHSQTNFGQNERSVRISRTAQEFRKKKAMRSEIFKDDCESLQTSLCVNPKGNDSLPIINEFPTEGCVRPQSQGRRCIDSDSPIRKRFSFAKQDTFETISIQNDSIISVNMGSSKISSISRFSNSLPKKTNTYFAYRKEQKQIGSNILKEFTQEGKDLYLKQLKLKKLGAKVLWENCTSQPPTLIYRDYKPLTKNLYYKVNRKHADECISKIIPYENYQHLFVNKNEEFLDILRELCKQLINIEDKIMMNSIRADNIYRLGEKQIYVGDWTNAGLKQEIKIGDQAFTKYHSPLLTEKSGKIICYPEYLAPQLLKAHQQQNTEALWLYRSSASDIWSIGCLIFELLTLIPLGAQEKHLIKGRKICRRGYLHMHKFEADEFIRKQKIFIQQYQRILKIEMGGMEINERILKVLKGCLKMKKEERISLQEMLEILSK